MSASGAGTVPLSRNRDYNILWTGQLLSELAVEMVLIATPLLILASSGAPWQLGVAAAAAGAAGLLAAVPAGALADRQDRRALMLFAQAGRVLAVFSLVVAVAMDAYSFPHVVAVMVVEGVLGSVFEPAEHAALPSVVPRAQLTTALARNTARPYVAVLLGPALAGVLFAAAPVAPFVAGTAVLLLSLVPLYFLRLPRRAPGDPTADGYLDGDPDDVGPDVDPDGAGPGERPGGFRWLLRNRVITLTLIWVTLTNLIFTALVVLVLVRSDEADVGAGEIGLTMAALGVGGVLGALCASRLIVAFRAPTVVLGFSWTVVVTTAGMAVVPPGIAFGALLGVAAFLAPPANTVVLTYQLLVTPDGLRGRLSGIVGLCSAVAGAAGPLAGGLLVQLLGVTAATQVCAAGFAVVAAAATASPTLRRFPGAPR